MAVRVCDIINAILLCAFGFSLFGCISLHLVFNNTSIVTSGVDYSELKH